MEKTFTFTMTEAEANTVLHFVSQGPYAQVFAIVAKMQQQAREQESARATRATEE